MKNKLYAICIGTFVITAAFIAFYVLGVLNVIHMSPFVWVLVTILFIALVLASFMSYWVLVSLLEERRQASDRRRTETDAG